jgi:hypothetical protein
VPGFMPARIAADARGGPPALPRACVVRTGGHIRTLADRRTAGAGRQSASTPPSRMRCRLRPLPQRYCHYSESHDREGQFSCGPRGWFLPAFLSKSFSPSSWLWFLLTPPCSSVGWEVSCKDLIESSPRQSRGICLILAAVAVTIHFLPVEMGVRR